MRRILLILMLFVTSLLFCGLAIPMPNGKEVNLYSGYHAFIIGNSNYQNFYRLPGVAEDVTDLKIMFEALDIKVTILQDQSGEQMHTLLNDLVDVYGKDPEQALIIYFAGHGYTEKRADGSDLGYIVPIDAPLYETNPGGFRNRAISMTKVNEFAELISSKHVLFIFDSCFSGTLFSARRGAPQIINEKTLQPVRQFITAGTAEQLVPDKSVFKSTLLKGLGEGFADLNNDGYITGDELGMYLEDNVYNYSRGQQRPKSGRIANSKLDRGDIVFKVPDYEKPVQKPEKIEEPPPPPSSVEPVISYGTIVVTSNEDGVLVVDENINQELKAGQEAHIKTEVGIHKLDMVSNGKKITDRVEVGKDMVVRVSFTFEKELPPPSVPLPEVANKTAEPIPSNMVLVSKGTVSNAKGSFYIADFYIDKYETTQKSYKQVMHFLPELNNSAGDNYPVYNVSWFDAIEYCNRRSILENLTPCYSYGDSGTDPALWPKDWKSKAENHLKVGCNWSATGYRLPTETEWELAAKGGANSRFYRYSGSNKLKSVAWFNGNNTPAGVKAAGTKEPNELGLHDMSGNVWEWVWDIYAGNYQPTKTDVSGPQTGIGRVTRGGAWYSVESDCQLDSRALNNADFRFGGIGFRVARNYQ